MRYSTCKGCGKKIGWITTSSGKSMPVDSDPVYYKQDSEGPLKIVTPSGRVICSKAGVEAAEADGIGFISHFATCPAANDFRKRGKKE